METFVRRQTEAKQERRSEIVVNLGRMRYVKAILGILSAELLSGGPSIILLKKSRESWKFCIRKYLFCKKESCEEFYIRSFAVEDIHFAAKWQMRIWTTG